MFFFTGPVLLVLATIFEWIMGNFFSMLVMGMYAVFWLSFGVIETPAWGIKASYSATGDAVEGGLSAGDNAAVALYLTVWGFWLFTSFIFSLRTNTVFALIFLCGFSSSFVFAASYWKESTGDHEMAMALQKVGSFSPNRYQSSSNTSRLAVHFSLLLQF
jgi:succinate-acetate transporter protein